MNAVSELESLLKEYPIESRRDFSGNNLASKIRDVIPKALSAELGLGERYIVEGSPGQGNWAAVPWIAVFDRLVTESAQRGYYVVLTPKSDFSGLFLSLNQGVTSVRKEYPGEAKRALQMRAKDFVARLGSTVSEFQVGPLDLGSSQTSSLASYYEVGAVCWTYFDFKQGTLDPSILPTTTKFLEIYRNLSESISFSTYDQNVEEDEYGLGFEDLQALKTHKRIERNRSLANRAKRAHGYTCQVCSFNFLKMYGPIGKNFIEAHHLRPLSELSGTSILLDPKTDFAVLCSNCHRMIHRSTDPGDILALRKAIHLAKSN